MSVNLDSATQLKNAHDALLRLQDILIRSSNGDLGPEINREYKLVRSLLMRDGSYNYAIPEFIRRHRDIGSLWSKVKAFSPEAEDRVTILKGHFVQALRHVRSAAALLAPAAAGRRRLPVMRACEFATTLRIYTHSTADADTAMTHPTRWRQDCSSHYYLRRSCVQLLKIIVFGIVNSFATTASTRPCSCRSTVHWSVLRLWAQRLLIRPRPRSRPAHPR